ncbi:MAG: hypothetical protein UCI02_00170, partial [Bifidobacterium criceti]|nr:hypothetical protein [Bifidobacterium criceti]
MRLHEVWFAKPAQVEKQGSSIIRGRLPLCLCAGLFCCPGVRSGSQSTADLGRNAMKRPEKEVVVAELTEAFRNADAVYLTEY